MRHRMIISTLVLTGAVLTGTAADAGGGVLSIRALKDNPGTFLNARVTVRCIFHGFDDRAAPLATEFSAGRYQNFSAWDDATPIWREQVFVHSSPIFFARFGSPVLKDLAKLKEYERIDVSGIVRTDYGGEPWVEVLEIRSLGETYREDALRAVRASEILRAKQMHSEALSWIEPVKTRGLPAYLRGVLNRERGFSLVASGDLRNGAKEFRRAARLDPSGRDRMEALAARADLLLSQDRPWSMPSSLRTAQRPSTRSDSAVRRHAGKSSPRARKTSPHAGRKTRSAPHAPRARQDDEATPAEPRPEAPPARKGGSEPSSPTEGDA